MLTTPEPRCLHASAADADAPAAEGRDAQAAEGRDAQAAGGLAPAAESA